MGWLRASGGTSGDRKADGTAVSSASVPASVNSSLAGKADSVRRTLDQASDAFALWIIHRLRT
jgi:hypothetical protein